MKRQPRVALAQIKYFDKHDRHNIEKIKGFIAEAAKGKADIVCFPETCIIREGYLNLNHKFVKEIAEECKKHKIWCIITDDVKHDSKIYNTAILIDRGGKRRGTYRKKRPYGEKHITPGSRVKVFNTDFGKIGIVICWDLAFSEFFQPMKKSGAQIIFCPAQWAYDEKSHDRHHRARELKLLKAIIQARAFENLAYVAFCSPYLKEKDLISYSAISSPHTVLKEVYNKEGLIFADLKLSDLTSFKKLYTGK